MRITRVDGSPLSLETLETVLEFLLEETREHRLTPAAFQMFAKRYFRKQREQDRSHLMARLHRCDRLVAQSGLGTIRMLLTTNERHHGRCERSVQTSPRATMIRVSASSHAKFESDALNLTCQWSTRTSDINDYIYVKRLLPLNFLRTRLITPANLAGARKIAITLARHHHHGQKD